MSMVADTADDRDSPALLVTSANGYFLACFHWQWSLEADEMTN